ncbi:2-amino-4-hydroxy-6-hydroxymethyldihydropteridine diphosphokinase [Candidatus Sulfidibacterium hydrothermale]|uniref:2-amino-4-hydroxy-6- hydroxymethyldihydropteridine diphosphokinase n=1 Tax=Candidatus Sulfidibacterium hydrothermale TaxID=2875962 RepID=UPI001F0B4932|nr:2-amino-4-hydroxy-6-hydroxymethyldihydropteridine diphosphokinase [Candidatus Sulfidibacterium hydrothermale]UBM62036.1 2-amino-4-hydroxy-6-hydroxymethyldihydropteridine diphosphokinase [Candidatus Sulfidibacterium hydrothermale]
MTNKHTVYLLLGSNIPSRTGYLTGGIRQIRQHIGKIREVSAVYESEPWGFDASVFFLNQVVCVETGLAPEKLLEKTQEIERLLGRKEKSKGEKYSSRTLDLDILFYDDAVIDKPDLTVPHPRMAERKFTLVPLAEIAPDKMHPVLNKSCAHLLTECADQGKVWKFEEKQIHAI